MTPGIAAKFALVAFAVGAAAALGALASGLGNRWGLWDYRAAFTLLGWAAWTGVGGAVLSLAALAWSGYLRAPSSVVWALIGLIAGALAFGLPWQMRRHAREVPPIHDITTDPINPPRFEALAPGAAWGRRWRAATCRSRRPRRSRKLRRLRRRVAEAAGACPRRILVPEAAVIAHLVQAGPHQDAADVPAAPEEPG